MKFFTTSALRRERPLAYSPHVAEYPAVASEQHERHVPRPAHLYVR